MRAPSKDLKENRLEWTEAAERGFEEGMLEGRVKFLSRVDDRRTG